jgi:hypothetical protein
MENDALFWEISVRFFGHRCIEGHAAIWAVVHRRQPAVFVKLTGFTRGGSQPCAAFWTPNEINGTGVQDKHDDPSSENASRRVAALALVEANRQPYNEHRNSESAHPPVDVIANRSCVGHDTENANSSDLRSPSRARPTASEDRDDELLDVIRGSLQ